MHYVEASKVVNRWRCLEECTVGLINEEGVFRMIDRHDDFARAKADRSSGHSYCLLFLERSESEVLVIASWCEWCPRLLTEFH